MQFGSEPKPWLKIEPASDAVEESFKDYIGWWSHTPIPSNKHVYRMVNSESNKILFWQNDSYHWRTSNDLADADPSSSSFGCGWYYLDVPGGSDMRYSDRYETHGLALIWDSSPESGEEQINEQKSEAGASPPPLLKIVRVSDTQYEEYAGDWIHHPLPTNAHVYKFQGDRTMYLFWQDDSYHWRTSGLEESADTTSSSFGSGRHYFGVPGGASDRYIGRYESEGLAFIWDGSGAASQELEAEQKAEAGGDGTSPPPRLKIVRVSDTEYEEYVGDWIHCPLPTNAHVYKFQGNRTMYLFWQGAYHWRTSSLEQSADTTSSAFGSGRHYFSVPGGEEARYIGRYESEGLAFIWDGSYVEEKPPPEPAPPSRLKIVKASETQYEEYVGTWTHTPIPTNPHVYRMDGADGTIMYWQDDSYHWRTAGAITSADPTSATFGYGSYYLHVPGGVTKRYAGSYETAGLRFIWDGSDAEEKPPPEPAPPARLKIVKASETQYEEYVGTWTHTPIPTNPHVYRKDGANETIIYWLDDSSHWRTAGATTSADPTSATFGYGSYYLTVPGGVTQRYAGSYETAGLRFIWDGSSSAEGPIDSAVATSAVATSSSVVWEPTPDDLAAALRAAATEGGAELNMSRINLVGPGRAGKTAMANALAGRPYGATPSTVGVDVQLLEVDRTDLLAGEDGGWVPSSAAAAGGGGGGGGDGGGGGGLMTAMEARTRLAAQKLAEMRKADKPSQPAGGAAAANGPSATRAGAVKEKTDAGTVPGRAGPVGGRNIIDILATPAPAAAATDVPEAKPAAKAPLPSAEAVVQPPAPAPDSGSPPPSAVGPAPAEEEAVMRLDMEAVVNLARSGADGDGGGAEGKAGKGGMRLSLWDFGGQEAFHVLHHLYLTRYAVYLVLFSMEWLAPGASDEAREMCLSHLRFWLGSIAVHAVDGGDGSTAPVILVGTHRDKVSAPRDHELISQLLWDTFSGSPAWRSVKALEEGTHESGLGRLWFFPVDNTAGPGDIASRQVRAAVQSCLEGEEYLRRKVPFAWLAVLDRLRTLPGGPRSVPLGDVVKIGRECGLPTSAGLDAEGETLLMLRLWNELGALMHSPEPALRHLVVLDPASFLVAPASRIVCQHGYHELPEHREARARLHRPYNRLCKLGLLDRALLPVLWRDWVAHMTELECLMVKYGLMVPLADADDADAGAAGGTEAEAERQFLVPALLPVASAGGGAGGGPAPRLRAAVIFARPEEMREWRAHGYVTVGDVTTDGFLPSGLFGQVVGRVVRECQRVHGASVDELDLARDQIEAPLGRIRFRLRAVGGGRHNSLELLVLADNPLLVVERLLAIVAAAVASAVPGLGFALAVPLRGGGAFDPAGPAYEDDPGAELVIIDGNHGLAARLESSGGGDVVVGRRTRMSRPEVRTAFGRWLPPTGLRAWYDVFISYRWGELDSDLAQGLFAVLSQQVVREERPAQGDAGDHRQRPVEVFLDRQRLELGRDFSQDFSGALLASRVAVPLVSAAAMSRMFRITERSGVDNVLLEWTLIVELLAAGALRFCLPVLIGRVSEVQEGGVGRGGEGGEGNAAAATIASSTNIFTDGTIAELPDVVCASVAARAAEILAAAGRPVSAELAGRTVRATVERLVRCLGVLAWADVPPASGGRMHGLAGFERGLMKVCAARVLDCVDRAAAAVEGEPAPRASEPPAAEPSGGPAAQPQPGVSEAATPAPDGSGKPALNPQSDSDTPAKPAPAAQGSGPSEPSAAQGGSTSAAAGKLDERPPERTDSDTPAEARKMEASALAVRGGPGRVESGCCAVS